MINNAKTDDRPKNGKTHCRRMNEKKQNKTKQKHRERSSRANCLIPFIMVYLRGGLDKIMQTE